MSPAVDANPKRAREERRGNRGTQPLCVTSSRTPHPALPSHTRLQGDPRPFSSTPPTPGPRPAGGRAHLCPILPRSLSSHPLFLGTLPIPFTSLFLGPRFRVCGPSISPSPNPTVSPSPSMPLGRKGAHPGTLLGDRTPPHWASLRFPASGQGPQPCPALGSAGRGACGE
jgi:hypothetical protein